LNILLNINKIIKILFFILVIFILYILVKIMVGAIPIPLEELTILAMPPAILANLQIKYLLISVAN
jgi:hypothetical protein